MKTQGFDVTEITGHWRVRWIVIRFDWILRNDGSFVGKCSVLGVPIVRLTGTWSIEGNTLVAIYNNKLLVNAGAQKDTDTLLEVAQDYFILVTRKGTRRRWQRVYDDDHVA